MRKYHRNRKKDTPSAYCVSPNIMISASSQMRIRDFDVNEEYLDTYDEESGRWFCSLGCGFRDHKDSYDVLSESTAMINRFLSERRTNDIVRESRAVAWTYHYDLGIFSCDYELTEYDLRRKRSTRFSVGSVNAKELEEIQKAIHAWHITGEMIWDILCIPQGDWEKNL